MLKPEKKPTLLKKILTIAGILFAIGYVVLLAFLKKPYY
jgi:hypothetical protein